MFVTQLTDMNDGSPAVDREIWQEHWLKFALVTHAHSSSFEMHNDPDYLRISFVSKDSTIADSNGLFLFDTWVVDQLQLLNGE